MILDVEVLAGHRWNDIVLVSLTVSACQITPIQHAGVADPDKQCGQIMKRVMIDPPPRPVSEIEIRRLNDRLGVVPNWSEQRENQVADPSAVRIERQSRDEKASLLSIAQS